MSNINTITDFVEKLNRRNDYLIEEIIVILLESGIISDSDWEMFLQGCDKRGYRKELDNYEVTREKKLKLDVNRDGFFEKLPEAFFLSNYYKDVPSSKVFDINEKERNDAKAFFQILEQIYFKVKVEIYRNKRDLHLGGKTKLFKDWNIPDNLTLGQKTRLLLILSLVKFYKKTVQNIKLLLGFVINLPVNIEMIKNTESPFLVTPNLGDELELGETFILGNTFCDYIPKYHIKIGEVGKTKILEIYSKAFYEQLKVICEFLLPAESTFSYELLLVEKEKDFILNDAQEFLGQTTYI